jgi:FHS family glucose/mannose:H+ symporter-like MFS transporter
MFNRKLVFFSACFGMLLFGIGLITLGSVASDLKSRFKLNGASTGTVFSILPIGILVGSLFFGHLGDKYGYKLILIISCLGMFAAFECIAFATSFALLKGAVFLLGACGGAINGATNALVSDISPQNKGADLSLLGVFFGLGALGMPLLLGILQSKFSVKEIVAAVGFLTLMVGVFFVFVRFPPAKAGEKINDTKNAGLFNNPFLILVAFFLFCQSGFEAIINNWTTTYLTGDGMSESNALYALSLHIVGMIAMRIVIGTALRKVSSVYIIAISFFFLLAGTLLLQLETSFAIAVAGLVLLGAGVAAGFPIMLGFVGEQYINRSGAAFSFVMVIALVGNMLINYGMGVIVGHFGISYLTSASYAVIIVMIVLCVYIFKKIKNQ